MLQRLKQMLIKEFLTNAAGSADADGYFRHAGDPDGDHGLCPDHGCHAYPNGRAGHGQNPSSRELINEFTAGGYFQIVHRFCPHTGSGTDLLDQATARAVITSPPGLNWTLTSGSTARFSSSPMGRTAIPPPLSWVMPTHRQQLEP